MSYNKIERVFNKETDKLFIVVDGSIVCEYDELWNDDDIDEFLEFKYGDSWYENYEKKYFSDEVNAEIENYLKNGFNEYDEFGYFGDDYYSEHDLCEAVYSLGEKFDGLSFEQLEWVLENIPASEIDGWADYVRGVEDQGMLLQFYTDETWGYDYWDQKRKEKEGAKVKFRQEASETREDFFKRVGFEPEPKTYGSDFRMDERIQDGGCSARAEVARQGYGLDILIHDEDPDVRKAVAEQGYGLDILVRDKDLNVRIEVARQGYGLNILAHDFDLRVKKMARKVVAEKGFPSIESWAKRNPKEVTSKKPLGIFLQFYTDETWGYDCWDEEEKKKEGVKVKFQQEEGESREDFFKRVGFEPEPKMYGSDFEMDQELRSNRNNNNRLRLARQGYGLDVLIKDKWDIIREEIARYHDFGTEILAHDNSFRVREALAEALPPGSRGIDILMTSEDEMTRCLVAEQGYRLEVLVYDKSEVVRAEVAYQGYGLDILANDESARVRRAVVRQGYGLERFVHDADWSVRAEVAHQGYGLESLIYDKNKSVRKEVAGQGYGLDILAHDEDADVREETEAYLYKYGYPSIEKWIEENPGKCADRRNRR